MGARVGGLEGFEFRECPLKDVQRDRIAIGPIRTDLQDRRAREALMGEQAGLFKADTIGGGDAMAGNTRETVGQFLICWQGERDKGGA